MTGRTRTIECTPWRDPMVSADIYDEVYPRRGRDDDEYGEVRKLFSEDTRPHFSPHRGPYWVSPMGVIPLADHNLAGHNYSLWNAHANFDLTPSAVGTVEGVEGVEILRVVTRYRALLGVGRRFDPHKVHAAINRALNRQPPAVADAVSVLAGSASAHWPCWAVVRDVDGRLRVLGADSPPGLERRLLSSASEVVARG